MTMNDSKMKKIKKEMCAEWEEDYKYVLPILRNVWSVKHKKDIPSLLALVWALVVCYELL